RDWRAMLTVMGDGPFFFGNEPTGVDAVVFAALATTVLSPIESPVGDFLRSQPAFVAYAEHMRARFADHEGNHATVAQRDAQRCAFESRHRNLVENRLVRSDPELGRKLKTCAATQEPRFDGFGAINALPRHRLAQLKDARELRW